MNPQEPSTAGVRATVRLRTMPQLRAGILNVPFDKENRYEARILEKSPSQVQPLGIPGCAE